MHNVTYYQRLMQRIRVAIAADDLAAVRIAVAAPPMTAEEGPPCQA